MKDKREHAGGRIAGLIISISIVVLAAVLPSVLAKVIPAYANTYLGWRPLVVQTNSMEGAIRKNGVVIVYAASWESLKVGDIISFELPDGRLDTHRVIAKDGAHIATKGDNTPAPDAGWVTQDSYRYKVMFVWNWVAWLSDHRGMACLIGLPPVIIVLVAAVVLIIRRARKNRELPPEYAQAEYAETPPTVYVPVRDDSDCITCLDELIGILDPLLALHEARLRKISEALEALKEKEKAYEPQPPQMAAPAAVPAVDDDNLDWDAWALMQLRKPAPAPGDAAPANRGENRPGALPGKSAQHRQQLPAPG